MQPIRACFTGVICLLAASPLRSEAAGDKAMEGDAEAAKHGFEASKILLIEEEASPGLVFQQYDLAVLSHYSYLLGSKG